MTSPLHSNFQMPSGQVSGHTLPDTADEGKIRLTIPLPEANIQSKRIEYVSSKSLLHHLKASLIQPLKDLCERLGTLISRSGDSYNFSEGPHMQHAELANNSADQRRPNSHELKLTSQERLKSTDYMTPAVDPRGSSFKTVLDTVSQLSTSKKIKQNHFNVTLRAEQINILQDAIIDGSVNFSLIDKLVKTRGDLQLVRTLALSLTHDEISNQPSIKAALANLTTVRPNTSVFLGGLMAFIQAQENSWCEKTENNLLLRFDAQAQSDFNSQQLKEHINRLSTHEAHNALEQLEGYFGQRAHGLMEIASDQLSDADDESSDKLLSRLTRAENLTDNLIQQLRAKLDMIEIEIPSSPIIESLNKLNPLELAALISIGIKLGGRKN